MDMGLNLGEAIRIFYNIQKNPSKATSSFEGEDEQVKEFIEFLMTGAKNFIASAIAEIKMKSEPVEMPAACMS